MARWLNLSSPGAQQSLLFERGISPRVIAKPLPPGDRWPWLTHIAAQSKEAITCQQAGERSNLMPGLVLGLVHVHSQVRAMYVVLSTMSHFSSTSVDSSTLPYLSATTRNRFSLPFGGHSRANVPGHLT